MSEWRLNPVTQPGPLPSLIWKNWRETRTLALALGGSILLILIVLSQLPVEIGNSLYGNSTESLLPLACIFPVGISLLVPVLAIGQDRQAGTWNWTSELPCSPFQHFLSWFLVWSVVAAAGWAILLVSTWLLTSPSIESPITVLSLSSLVWVSVICINTMIIMTSSMLWFRDPLKGLVVGGVTVYGVQLGIYVAVERLQEERYWTEGGWLFVWLFWIATVGGGGAFSILAAWLYDWRWRRGQYFHWSISLLGTASRRQVATRIPGADDWSRYAAGTDRRRGGLLLRHCWFLFGNQFWTTLVVVSLYLALVVGVSLNSLSEVFWITLGNCFVFVVAYLGVSVGNSLLKQEQFRFFSDRGWRTGILWDASFFVHLAAITGVVVVIAISGNSVFGFGFGNGVSEALLGITFALLGILPIYVLMVWSGLLMRNSLVALGTGAIATIFFFLIFAFSIQYADAYFPPFAYSVRWSPVIGLTLIVLGLVLSWLVTRQVGRHWMIYGRVDWMRLLLAYGVLVTSAPLLILTYYVITIFLV